MKTILTFGTLFFLSLSGLFAQKAEDIRITGKEAADFVAKSEYKFPAFIKARVYLKNDEIASGKLNFDYFSDAMKYIDEKGDTLAIANEKDIKYIGTPTDTFFYDNKYYEWVASSATARLSVRRTLKVSHTEEVGAYGISTSTNRVENHDLILDITDHHLDVNKVIVFQKQTTYYISAINGHFEEANKKSISKLFPKKNIEDYIDTNRLNLNKEEDLVDVFVYANKP